ncbi:major capsid protein E [Staphylococcus simulans]|uniref:major capsid protein n=1 Tax=Staphylococcus simulans TaxID=1286 RepID=UPI0030BD5D6F
MVLEDVRLQPATLAAFVQRADELRDEALFPLTSAFPVEPVEDIDNVYNIISQQMNVAASITGFNSGSPIRDIGQGKQALASLTKIQDAYFLDEKQILNYKRRRSQDEANGIVDQVLINTNHLSEGVEKTKELIRASLDYKGRFDYEDPRTQTKLSYTLDRPEENNITVTEEWGTEAARPISDLLAAVDQFRQTNGGARPEVINMNSATYAKFKRSGQIALELFRDVKSPYIVKDSDVEALITSSGLPAISIDDTETQIRQIDGTNKTVKHLEDDRVVLRASVLGTTMSGPSVENNFNKGKFILPIQEFDPPREKTIVGEAAMPVMKNINGTVFLDVKPADTVTETSGV